MKIMKFYLDGFKLARVEEAKFLGITIDENLTWKKQVRPVNRSEHSRTLRLYFVKFDL